jgi:hypothetical protein
MIVLKHLTLYGAILSVLYLSGWGLAVSVCRGVSARYLLALAPLLAIIPLSIIPLYASLAGLPVAIGGWAAFLICASWTVFQISRNRLNPFKDPDCPSWLILIWILAAFPTFRLLAETGFITSAFQSYGAFVTFPADYFLNHSWHDTVTQNFEKPMTQMLSQIFEYDELFPYFFLVSTFAALLGMPAYKIYLAVSAILSAFLPIAAYMSCRVGFKFDQKSAILVAGLTAINISYFYWPLIGQLPQILGVIFYILGLGFLKIALETDKKIDLVFYSVIVTGFLTMYVFMLSHLVGAAIFYGILQFRNFDQWKLALKNSFFILVCATLLSPVTIWWVIEYAGEYAKITSQFTNNIPRIAYLEELFGFSYHFSESPNSKILDTVGWVWSALALAGIYISIKKRESLLLADICFMVVFAGYFFAIDYRYHFYKHSVVAVFPLILTVVLGTTWGIQHFKQKALQGVILIIFLTGLFLNLKNYVEGSNPALHPVIGADLIALENLDLPAESKILVHTNTPTEEVWLSYFLKNKKIKLTGRVEPWGFWIFSPFTGKVNSNYFYDPLKDKIDVTLSINNTAKKDIFDTQFGEKIYENERYKITKGLPQGLLLKGWYGLEKSETGSFRWTQKESQILFNKLQTYSELLLEGEIPKVYNEKLSTTIFLNGKELGRFQAKSGKFLKTYSLNGYLLKPQGNRLTIRLDKTFNPSELGESPDKRNLGIQIKKIQLLPTSKK